MISRMKSCLGTAVNWMSSGRCTLPRAIVWGAMVRLLAPYDLLEHAAPHSVTTARTERTIPVATELKIPFSIAFYSHSSGCMSLR